MRLASLSCDPFSTSQPLMHCVKIGREIAKAFTLPWSRGQLPLALALALELGLVLVASAGGVLSIPGLGAVSVPAGCMYMFLLWSTLIFSRKIECSFRCLLT